MTTQRFAIEPNGPKRLVISWEGQFKNFTIKLDEQMIGLISGQKELKAGRKFQLPDGSVLKVQLVGLFVRLYRDENPIPGSPDDPAQKIKNAYIIIFVTAGSNIIGNLLAPLSVNFLVFGLGFLGLGFLVKRRSLPALMIAFCFYIYFDIKFFVLSYQNSSLGWTTVVFFLPLYLLIFAYMYQGGKAIRTLNKQTPISSQIAAPLQEYAANSVVAQSEVYDKQPRSNLVKWISVGCLTIIVCLGVGFSALFFSGKLSGPHGDLDEMPAWSPDGTRIAFMSNRDGFSDIYVMNIDGSGVVQLTRDSLADLYFIKSPTDTTPAWSPDSKRIAFASGRDNGMMTYVDLNIYVMNADGSRVIELNHQDSVDQAPVWSPDGKHIAYTVVEAFARDDRDGQMLQNPTWNIHVMDADGSHDIQLTNGKANEYGIAWSPDGSHIAFVSDINGNADLYVMKSDGSNVVQLTMDSTNEGAPDWSPDGKHIAFVSDRGGKTAIFVMNADGSNIVQLTSSQSNAYNPSWSPNSNYITFASDHAGNDDIYVMDVNGANIVQLTGK